MSIDHFIDKLKKKYVSKYNLIPVMPVKFFAGYDWLKENMGENGFYCNGKSLLVVNKTFDYSARWFVFYRRTYATYEFGENNPMYFRTEEDALLFRLSC